MGKVIFSIIFFSALGLVTSMYKKPGDPIKCVQCSHTAQRCESGALEPTYCGGRDKYCAMYRVFVGNSQGVYRGCSDTWLRGCRRRVIDGREFMICIHTCSWDGCNASRSQSSSLM